jgi:hypothetical protein
LLACRAMRSTQRLLLSAVMFATTFVDRPTSVLVLPIVVPPVTVTVVREVPAEPPPPPPPAPDPLGCLPPPVEGDAAIGAPLAVRTLRLDDDVAIVAAAATPVIGVRGKDGRVRVSDDDGATWHRAFAGRSVDELAIDGAGTLYARSGGMLGSRDPESRRERWRETPFEGGRIGVVGVGLIWLHAGHVDATTDRGASWRAIAGGEETWATETDGDVFAWRGSLYQVVHYWDMCGVDDWPVWRLTGARVQNAIFHAGYGDDDTFEAADDVATSWRWRSHCPACGHAGDGKLLAAQKLLPVEGGRTLAVYQHSLVELCEGGGRQIYRAFPFERIAAVDSAGRPLVAADGVVARWSPAHGWRRGLALSPRP